MAKEPLDVMDFVLNKGHGVRGLASMGLNHVPDKYLQPPEERLDAARVAIDNVESIPIIDVSNLEASAEPICDAATRYGFFQIVNHGVPMEVLDEVQASVHRFFELPVEEKVKYKEGELGYGHAKFVSSFSPLNEKVLEWKDCLSLNYTNDEVASQNWPPTCKKEALNYYKMIDEIITKIFDVLLKGLNIETGFDQSKRSMLMGWIAINLNYYPRCPNPELTVGLGRHSDASALTVLLQDDVGGLYVRAPQGESWIQVPPKRGALVINIGDVMQMISNGRYQSVEHRVVTSADRDRVSVAVFANPAFREVIGPLPEVVGSGEESLYREVLYKEYCNRYFGRGLDGKKAIEWARI